ncbi:MAG: hypothetical protein ACK48E_05975 [Holosporales bacterium]
MSLWKGAVQPPRSGGGARPSALRGGGEKPLVVLILNTPFFTFPRCAGEGGNGRRRYSPIMLE